MKKNAAALARQFELLELLDEQERKESESLAQLARENRYKPDGAPRIIFNG